MASNFVDYVKIYCKSGHGGPGSAHLRHVKYIEKGGPDGGDGGRGGHVIVRGSRQFWTLIHLKFARHVFAEDGEGGGRERAFGRDGKDQIIEVPLGTVVKDADSGDVIFEITEDGEEKILAKGGRGGQGSSAPRRSKLRVSPSPERMALSLPPSSNSRSWPTSDSSASPMRARARSSR